MSLRKNQLGALNPLVIVLVVVVLGAIGFAGYKVYDNNKNGSSSNGSTSELSKEAKEVVNTECEKQYNDKDFCKFASNWDLSKTYKTVSATTGADGKTSTTTMEIDGENSSMVSTENGKEIAAYITLNKTSYMKDYDAGVWYKMPQADASNDAPVSSPSEEFDFDGEENAAKDNSSVKALGKEACSDKNCFKYQIIDPSDTDTKENLVWFDDKDYKLVRMKITSKDGSAADYLFTYPDSIKITEPKPVQDFPSFDPSTLGQ